MLTFYDIKKLLELQGATVTSIENSEKILKIALKYPVWNVPATSAGRKRVVSMIIGCRRSGICGHPAQMFQL